MRLQGARILVTGASSGIGRELAVALSRHGARVLVAGRDAVAVGAVAERVGGTGLVADLRRVGGAAELAAAALAAVRPPHPRAGTTAVDSPAVQGGIDAIVLNAGVGWRGSFTEMTAADVDELVRVNLVAPIELTRALLPHLLARAPTRGPSSAQGHIVVVSSVAGVVGVAEEAVYSATKAGLITFAESLRYELRGTGVAVTTIIPGVVDTAFFSRRARPYHRTRPRPLPPEQLAEAIVHALVTGAAEVIVPRWLAVPIRLRGLAPRLYRRLAGRFG